MGYEIDFLDVGNGEKSGDAISFRVGNLFGPREEQFVVVVDGGTKESGIKLVDHIRKYYQTNKINMVISTHPDYDHSSGLSVILQDLDVNAFLMHRPWNYADKILENFDDGRLTANSLSEYIKKELSHVYELEKLANLKGIPIFEPFSGDTLDFSFVKLNILNPSVEYYLKLLPYFRCMPKLKPEGETLKALQTLLQAIKTGTYQALREFWSEETLIEPGDSATSAENNSSVVLSIRTDEVSALLTGDAGVPALVQSVELSDEIGIGIEQFKICQVPHHGSKRNVGPEILDRIIGPKKSHEIYNKNAVVSCAKNGNPKHPSKRVVNAFKRRGAQVYATKGSPIYFFEDNPNRGWGLALPLPFYEEVEEDSN